MLEGATPWPAALAARYRAAGLWIGETLPALFSRAASRWPERPALVHGTTRHTYASLAEEVDLLACGFLATGLRPLDRVVVQLPNTVAFVTTYLALVRIGAIPVMALRAHRHSEVAHFLASSGAAGYVIPDRIRDFDYRAMARELGPRAPALKWVFVAGEPAPGQLALDTLAARPPSAALRLELEAIRPEPTEVATMLLSGGTTSISKLIPRTHEDYALNARLCGAVAGFSPATVLLTVLPLGHNYNLASPGLLGAFHHGGCVVLADAPDPAEVFALVERERVTNIAAAVPLIKQWLDSPLAERHDTGSLAVITNGGARLAPELRARLRERFGCVPQEIYGTAEGLINMTRLDDPDPLLLESSGAPVSDADEIRVVDDAGREVDDDATGELETRGPYTIHGYFRAAEKNAEAFAPDGFYRMGDVVRRRGRYLYTEGRRKDLVNRGGEKISCDEVENLIYGHPKVRLVALVAMPDPVFGEKACAFVVPHAGQTLGFDELIGYLRSQRIASFKLPERLEVVDELPTSPVGKILKSRLREAITARLAEEAAARAR
jgi:2,3-dihydroxybenzoate-AMP ligase